MTDPHNYQVALPANYTSPYTLIRDMQIHHTWPCYMKSRKCCLNYTVLQKTSRWDGLETWYWYWYCCGINPRINKWNKMERFLNDFFFSLLPIHIYYKQHPGPTSIIWQNTQLENKCTFSDPLNWLYPKRQPDQSTMRPAWDITKSTFSCSMCCLHMHSPALLAHSVLPLMVKAFVIWCWLINSNGNTYTYCEKNTYQSFKKKW